MARGQDLLFAHHGSSKEDNASKNLCWLLNHLPHDVAASLLRPIIEAFDQQQLLDKLDPEEDIEVVAQESAKVTKTRTGTKVLLGLAPKTHSYSDVNISDFTPESDNITSESVPDLAIQLGEELVIAIEAKDGGFKDEQLQNHVQRLTAEAFETVTWSAIADQVGSIQDSRSHSDREIRSIDCTSLPSGSVELLLNEYKNILYDQLIPQGKIIASSGYSKGENYVKARKEVGSDTLTGRVSDEPSRPLPVPVEINFRASGDNTDGQRLWFSREEWVSLLKSISNPEYHHGLARGDISGIVTDYDSNSDDDMKIAHIEDSDGNEKGMFYGTGKDSRTNPLLFMNRITADGGTHQQPPMYDPDEFDKLFANNNQMMRLFTNPNTAFDKLEEEL